MANLFNSYNNTVGPGAIKNGFESLFGNDSKNPYESAQGFYNQIPGQLHQGYDPYINAGHEAMGQTQGQYGQLINDPNSIYNKLAGGYKQSPGFQWQMGQGINAANNAAAAGGMIGSPQHQQQAATMAEGLANQDFQNYMNSVTGLYGTGLQGMQGISNTGYGASTGLADSLANHLSMQGQTAFAGQAAQNQSKGDMWGNILGGAGALAAFL